MGIECAYSFSDLFQAVHGRDFTAVENEYFVSLNQEQRNTEVAHLAARAGWKTVGRLGDDGIMYLAFFPKEAVEQGKVC